MPVAAVLLAAVARGAFDDDPISRTHVSATVDVSTKLTKLLPDFTNEKWGIDGARLIVEPYASLSWLSTNELDSSFGRIDRRRRMIDAGTDRGGTCCLWPNGLDDG